MTTDWFSPSAAHILLILFILVVVGYVLYSGACTKVTVRTGSPPIKRITFAYKFKVGAYKHCGALYREAHSLGPKLPCIGVFYSDPQRVLGKLCCYAVGSILSEDESQINMELLRKYEAAGFNIFCFPEAMQAVTTSFPYRTYLSIYLRLIKIYPPVLQYIKIKESEQRSSGGERGETSTSEHGPQERNLRAHPFVEIYKDGQIQFMAPLDRQLDFYVPEYRSVERRLSEQEESDSSTDVSGAESNSEDSSERGVLPSDSRETSLAASSVRVQQRRVQRMERTGQGAD